MNGGMIRFILGSVLKVESVLLLFPCIVAVFYRESAGYWFLLTAVPVSYTHLTLPTTSRV